MASTPMFLPPYFCPYSRAMRHRRAGFCGYYRLLPPKKLFFMSNPRNEPEKIGRLPKVVGEILCQPPPLPGALLLHSSGREGAWAVGTGKACLSGPVKPGQTGNFSTCSRFRRNARPHAGLALLSPTLSSRDGMRGRRMGGRAECRAGLSRRSPAKG
jgi:hypothetical protein